MRRIVFGALASVAVLVGASSAAAQAGYEPTEDYNGFRQEGFGRMEMSVRKGTRCSAAKAYLYPARKRANLTVVQHALATRVLFEAKRAVDHRPEGRLGDLPADGDALLVDLSANDGEELPELAAGIEALNDGELGIDLSHIAAG